MQQTVLVAGASHLRFRDISCALLQSPLWPRLDG
jgi:hypothetical protein